MMRPVKLAALVLSVAAALGAAACQRKPEGAPAGGSAAGLEAGSATAPEAAKDGVPGSAHPTPSAAAGGAPAGQPSAPMADGAWRATPLGRDLDRICNVIERAGVAQLPEGEQVMATIAWLPKNIESDAGREFLASIANLDGNAKADALEAGARRVGLGPCPVAQMWRQ